MDIKAKIKLAAVFVYLAAFFISVSIYYLLVDYGEALDKVYVAENIAHEVFERRLLADEFVTFQSERAKLQWASKQISLDNILAANKDNFRTPAEQELVSRIEEAAHGSTELFNQLIGVFADPNTSARQDKVSRISSQLSVRAQEAITAADRLAQINRDNVDKNFRNIFLIFSVALASLVGVLLFSFRIIWRSASELFEKEVEEEALLESIGEGIIAADQTFNVLVVNPAAKVMLGWILDDAEITKAMPLLEDSEGNKISREDQPFSIALRTGEKFVSDITSKNIFYYIRKDGTKFPVAITATPVILNGKTIGVIVVFRDITREIELDRAKSEFISLASHQLKTPPAAIKWNLELFLDGNLGPLTSRQRETLEEINGVSQKMLEVIESLLNVSRIELGTFMVQPMPINYKDVMKELLLEYKSKIEEKKLVVKESYIGNIPLIPADPGLAKIICENILSNAIKYTPEGGEINISIAYQDNDKNLLITVKDTGFGIPEKQKPQIFTKMFRADNIRGRADGTGFGLYFVKSIVEFADGRIWFESEEGKGTTFYISLPISGMKQKEGTSRISEAK